MIEPNTQQFIDGLRALADWYENKAEVLDLGPSDFTINLWAWNKDTFAAKAKEMGRAEKVKDDTYYMLRKQFGPYLRVDLNSTHETICEKVKVGEEVIPEKIVPAQAEQIIPAKVVEKFEWRCPESILRVGVSAAAERKARK